MSTNEQGSLFHTSIEDGIAVVTIDDKSAPHNTLTRAFGEEADALFAGLLNDASVRAVVLVSGKADSFIVGANIDMLASITRPEDAEALAGGMADVLNRVERSRKPFVAAVNGPALGGGFEVALACRAIVVSDDKKTVLGLPEVQLGLLPGANGLLRLAERAGLAAALDLGLTGKNLRPSKAKKLGVADEVVAAPILRAVAIQIAKKLADGETLPKPKPKLAASATRTVMEDTPVGRALVFKKAREATRKKTRGHYPATERILDVLERWAKDGREPAAVLEKKAFG